MDEKMTDAQFRAKTGNPMPKRLLELELTEKQLSIAHDYWIHRMNMARQQRNAVVGLVLVVGSTLLTKFFVSTGLADPVSQSQITSLVDTIAAWAIPFCVGLSILLLIATESAVYMLNRVLTDPAVKLQPKAVDRITKMGNSAAMHILLFRKIPPKEA